MVVDEVSLDEMSRAGKAQSIPLSITLNEHSQDNDLHNRAFFTYCMKLRVRRDCAEWLFSQNFCCSHTHSMEVYEG